MTTSPPDFFTLDPPRIIAEAVACLDSPMALAGAYVALSKEWPGYFATYLDFEERLRSLAQTSAKSLQALELIPVKAKDMVEGETYLGASPGTSLILAEVFHGPCPKARAFAQLYRISKTRSV